MNVSPMKMGPEGHVSAQAYKNLCQAYSSLVPINQMNACAGDNSRKKLIPMLMKTFDIGTIEATGLLHCVVCDTAIDINAVKLNCAEDRRIRWTTYQNLALWFDSWEAFLIDYGFAIISKTGELNTEETHFNRQSGPTSKSSLTSAFVPTRQRVFRRGLLGSLFLGERIQRQG